ncbi:hypothetical protein KI688_010493 [Linnemannia hyalina]|uniref:C2H2-type domain-containing protein n=1 Tax=Linnemannia hyalina TaxID=64524 RepID=A0A9P7XY18_9FUNG|nr:hypothetical protein KI688_010493 [Linnemannia hyalina]
MVHHKFKAFRDNNPDLSAICHVDFFDSAPDLSEADACHIWLSCLAEMAKDADPATKASMALLKEKYLKDKKNGNLRRYWDRRKLEQEAEKSQNEATMQTAITVNRTATRVVQSAEKQVNGHLEKIDSSVFPDDESSGQAAVRTSSVSSSSSLSTLSSTALSSPKKRKRSTMVGGSMSTRIEDGGESLLKSRKERFAAMNPSRFWKLRSGRTVEEILYISSLNMDANFKMRSYTIDFGCERTKAAFSDDEWMEMEELNDFQLPKIPESTRRLQCLWCPKAYQTRKGVKTHFSTCPGFNDLSFPRSCTVCGVKIETAKALQLHILDCKSWPEEDDDFSELDAQLIAKTGHPATARFVNDLFEQAEVTLPRGEKVYAYLPVGSSKRLGDGTEAYIRPMKRRSDRVIVDSKLELSLRSHAYCSLVDIGNYKALGVKDPICTLRFSDHSKQLARNVSSPLIQSGDDVLLCLKVEVYGRRESEDAHHITKLGHPNSSRPFKVANRTHDNTQMVIIGTVRWNALVTMAVLVTSGRVIVGSHNPWFHPHAASHVWLLKNGDEDLNNNVERHTRSKFDQASSYELFAAAHPRFLGHCTLPVTLSTLWDFK